jgi:hypothetical protein
MQISSANYERLARMRTGCLRSQRSLPHGTVVQAKVLGLCKYVSKEFKTRLRFFGLFLVFGRYKWSYVEYSGGL